MFEAPDSRYLVPFDGSFSIAKATTKPTITDGDVNRQRLKTANKEMDHLQRILMAEDRTVVAGLFLK